MYYTQTLETPIGPFQVVTDAQAVLAIHFPDAHIAAGTDARPEPMQLALDWLDAYFVGREPGPMPPLAQIGTPFQQTVWRLLTEIPPGHTTTYRTLAEAIAHERGIPRMAAQAVGGAVGRNPFAIMVPCHRVVGSDGSLVGYGGGIALKRWLLAHEGAPIQAQ